MESYQLRAKSQKQEQEEVTGSGMVLRLTFGIVCHVKGEV
jgi:hypothetical protein